MKSFKDTLRALRFGAARALRPRLANEPADSDKGAAGDAPAVSFADVRTTFGDELILDELNFRIERGEFICFLGPSGCGKSTTLRLIGDLLRPNSGVVTVLGVCPSVAWRRLAFVFQSPRLMAWRTVLRNVTCGLELRGAGSSNAERRSRALEALELVGLENMQNKFPNTLSGGERQRVAIARALVLDPDIILMDEPFSALDVATKERSRVEILRLWERMGKTIIFVTHDIDEALFLADRVLVFSNKPTTIVRDIALASLDRPRDIHSTGFESIRSDIVSAFGLNSDAAAARHKAGEADAANGGASA